jgi:hypothetical protein
VTERELGIAIHGAGWVAHAHAASWRKNPHAQIVSVSDVDRERAKRCAAEMDFHVTNSEPHSAHPPPPKAGSIARCESGLPVRSLSYQPSDLALSDET